MKLRDLFEAQFHKLALALSARRGNPVTAEALSLRSIAATVENSVADLFAATGLSTEVAEIAAKAYAAGWIDALHRDTSATIADAVLERTQPVAPVVIAAAPRLLN